MDLKEVDIIEGDVAEHWYYKSKAAALVKYLGGNNYTKILDIGAGSGFFSKYLLQNSDAAGSECVDIGYDATREERIGGKVITYTASFQESDADLVLLMDVLEHVDDDHAFVKDLVAKIADGSTVLITVPAFDFLWSRHDDFLGHKRRYTLKKLLAALQDTGLDIRKANYYFAAIFPIAVLVRIGKKMFRFEQKSDIKVHSPLVNSLLSAVCLVETKCINWNKLFGLTLFCLCKKSS